jgi:hypothetical protein
MSLFSYVGCAVTSPDDPQWLIHVGDEPIRESLEFLTELSLGDGLRTFLVFLMDLLNMGTGLLLPLCGQRGTGGQHGESDHSI